VQQPVTPVVQIPAATPDVSVPDVLIGSFGLVGVLSLMALVAGLIAGGGFILFRRWQARRDVDPNEDDHIRLHLSA
jgi:hypothetical protein